MVNSAAQMAEKECVLVIFATGEGETTPAGADGAVNTIALLKPKLAVACTIGGKQTEIIYAGAAPTHTLGAMGGFD